MVEPNYLNIYIYMCFHYTLANFYFNSESTPSIYKSRDSLDPPLTFSLSLSLVLTRNKMEGEMK